MDALWWFYTIVLGAAFAQIAVTIAVQWKNRATSDDTMHAPTMLWLVFLLVLTIEVWIAVGFYQRSVTEMPLLSLLAFLWVPMGIFILAIFLADPLGSGGELTDEGRFNRLRHSFFIVLFLIPVVNFTHEAIRGSIAFDADLLFPGLIAAGAVVGYFIRSRRADTVLAAAMLAVITVYLFTSYGTISAG